MARYDDEPEYWDLYTAPSLAAARRHAKEAGPVFKPGGRMVTHKLTQTKPEATA